MGSWFSTPKKTVIVDHLPENLFQSGVYHPKSRDHVEQGYKKPSRGYSMYDQKFI